MALRYCMVHLCRLRLLAPITVTVTVTPNCHCRSAWPSSGCTRALNLATTHPLGSPKASFPRHLTPQRTSTALGTRQSPG
ncbi:hypothetical protein BBK36DRAFT_169621, partial [Trichoderma citrinoviride]